MNPFNYQGPVVPPRLIDRRAELDVLQRAAADGISIRLAAPRRFGKTSVLDSHSASMRSVGHRAVRVDLSKVATVGDVAARVAEAFSVLPTDPRRSVRRWAARLGISARVAGVQVWMAPAPRAARPAADEARAALLELLDVPLRIHEAEGGLTVVCLDEFQDLLVADDTLDGLFRSVIQHHGGAAAYVFAGSQPSLMRALFSDRERPFYGQARPLELPPLPVDEAASDVEALLAADGLDAGGAVDELLAFTGGHPQRTVLLAHHLYNVLDQPDPPDDPTGAAIDLGLAETRDAHQAIWDAISRVERIVLLALADGQAPTGSRVADEHRIARSTLQDALERLLADERNVRRDDRGRPALLDPLLGEWLRRR
ncbi:MAG TPA: hypothetical protein VG186_00435 [Solirubrobacteraceae bacterium]|nr:hypothetical protein [Solirubrobacteraceae bacterium]